MSNYEITWHHRVNVDQTDAMFYCWGEGETHIATLVVDSRTFHIIANGEMRLNLPNGDVIRYTDALLSAGIDTDDKLNSLINEHPEALVNNNWFEWYEVDEGVEVDPFWEVQDDVEECIAGILNLLDRTKVDG